MKIAFSREAVARLEEQVNYLRDAYAPEAAERLKDRVLSFVGKHLANFPRVGHKLMQHDLWEIWVPKARLVLWYKIKGDTLVIVTVWHNAQDRASSIE